MSSSTGDGVNSSVVEAVREDPDLLPEEKETVFRFAKDEDRVSVFTTEAGLMRRLLQHPEFDVDGVVTEARAEVESVAQLHPDEDTVVGVRGTIPVGALKVSARARTVSGHAHVVSPNAGGDS